MIPSIPFNKAVVAGKELDYVRQSIESGKLSGNGPFSQKCEQFLVDKFGFKRALLTTSCTDALEMCALLLDLKPGDEVIIPSYTFVSTANPFMLRGATIRFADSEPNHPNIDVSKLESLINQNTKAIIVVHYGGMACDMEALQALCKKHNLMLVEDAAHAYDAYYNEMPLGRFGQLATYSFHDTKNIICGEGGALLINDPTLVARAEILREKGTNRAAFFRGEVDKYNWQDIGSSFLPADYVAAFLWGQLEVADQIQAKRLQIWECYQSRLAPLSQSGHFDILPVSPNAKQNAHLYALVCKNLEERTALIAALKSQNISAVFHYLSLHQSPYYHSRHDGRDLPHADRYTDCLVRLPLFYEMTLEQVDQVCEVIEKHFQS